jgi:hypothetical protein
MPVPDAPVCDAIKRRDAKCKDPRYLKDSNVVMVGSQPPFQYNNKLRSGQRTTRYGHAYKNAAMKAPKPRMLPAAALTLTAALPVADAPVPEADLEAFEPEASAEPVESAPELVVAATNASVVLLFALTVRVRLELTMEPVPVPARVRV